MIPLNTPIGPDALCAWQPVRGFVRVQTRIPAFARKLRAIRNSRLVAHGVVGGYLRIFEFRQNLAWARKLIARYTIREMLTNGPETALASTLHIESVVAA